MEICIVSQQFTNIFSGVGLHTNILINDLIEKNYSITLIVPEDERPSGDVPFEVKTIKPSSLIKSQARWFVLSRRFSNEIKKLERKKKFDLIHFTDFRDSIFCQIPTPQIANVNDTYSIEVHSLKYYKKNYFDWFRRWIYYHFSRCFEVWKLQKLDYIIVNSTFTHDVVKQNCKLNLKRLCRCYKSVDLARYQTIADERLSMSNLCASHQILFVGGNMQRKGIIDLIKAAPIIKKSYFDVKFKIAGRDQYIPQYKSLCKDLGVADNFTFLGWVSQDQLLQLYKSSAIFILPSLTEALGVVFLEAMAAAVPVIGTNVGGIPEIIHHNKNGILVPVSNPNKIAMEVIRLFSDPVLSKNLAVDGMETVKEFSIKKMMACTNRVYSKFISTQIENEN